MGLEDLGVQEGSRGPTLDLMRVLQMLLVVQGVQVGLAVLVHLGHLCRPCYLEIAKIQF